MPRRDFNEYADDFVNSDKEKIDPRADLRDSEGQDLIENPDFLRQDDFGANKYRMQDTGAIGNDVPLAPADDPKTANNMRPPLRAESNDR